MHESKAFNQHSTAQDLELENLLRRAERHQRRLQKKLKLKASRKRKVVFGHYHKTRA